MHQREGVYEHEHEHMSRHSPRATNCQPPCMSRCTGSSRGADHVIQMECACGVGLRWVWVRPLFPGVHLQTTLAVHH